MSSTLFGIAFSSHLILLPSQAVDKGLFLQHAASTSTTSTATFNHPFGYKMMIYFMSLPSWVFHSSFSAAYLSVLLPTFASNHVYIIMCCFVLVPLSFADTWTYGVYGFH